MNQLLDKLSDHTHFKSHNRHINYADAKELGLNVTELEADQDLQDLVLSVFHATTITFNDTVAVKIIENQNGKIFIKGYSPPE